MNSMPIIEGLTVYDNTKQLFSDYTNFANTYEKYVSCNNNITNNKYVDMQCSDADLSLDSVKNAYNVITDPDTGSLNVFTDEIQKQSYHSRVDGQDVDMMNLHSNKVVKLRKDIEEKIKMLDDVQNSIESDFLAKKEATLYTSMVMSVVVSSFIYYFFIHMEK